MPKSDPQGGIEVKPKKRGRPAGSKTSTAKMSLGSLDSQAKSFLLFSLRASAAKKDEWRGITAVPPGTILERILDEFQKNTSIPLEVPFFTLMHYVAGYLISKKVKLKYRNDEYNADFWTLILSTSGSGKTFTEGTITKGLGAGVIKFEPSAASSVRFLDELQHTPQALWVQDEFYNHFLKELDKPNSPMAPLRGDFLQMYDNKPIKHSTMRDKTGINIPEPILSILGFNAAEPFVQGMSMETMTDGLAQRFGFVMSKPDPKRNWQNYPHWEIDAAAWGQLWETIIKDIQPVYTASEQAIQAYEYSFKHIAGTTTVDESFYRRIFFRAHKYALVYHILRGQAANPVIDPEDYGWAIRVLQMQLSDAAELIEKVGGSDLKKQLEQATAAIEKIKAAGEIVNARAIIRRCSQIKTAASAKFILELLGIYQQ